MTSKKITVTEAPDLEKQIQEAKKLIQKRKKQVVAAENLLEAAEDALYQLEYERESKYLHSLDGKIDWDLVFKYGPDETDVTRRYRESVLESHRLEKTGHYNGVTKQHVFCISFTSNSAEEFHANKGKVEFIFQHLVYTPKEQTKGIVLHNIRGDDNYVWELVHSKKLNKFLITHTAYSRIRESYEFDTLDAALTKAQSMSDIAFESMDVHQLP